MAKVTSKLQVTIPKKVAEAHRIAPGTIIEFESQGPDSLRVRIERSPDAANRDDVAWRLKLFDEATERQEQRNREWTHGSGTGERGWTREDLYDRDILRR